MIFEKKWKIILLIEGEKEARLVASEENIPIFSDSIEEYPIEFENKVNLTYWQAIKKARKYSELNIYHILYKKKSLF